MMLEEMINTAKTTELFKKLKKNKNNQEIALAIINEIERRLINQEYTFAHTDTNHIYTYMLVANKFEHTTYLDKLISDEDFLKVLDKTSIDGAIIPSITSNCSKPRTALLKKSELLSNSILEDNSIFNTEDILADLTPEEIKILRENICIDNLLISKGLRFDTLRLETEKMIVEDINYLKSYDINTIAEFTNNTRFLKSLAINQNFLKLYLKKIDNNYRLEHQLFKILTKKQTLEIISNTNQDHVILNIIKSAPPAIQKELLTKKNVKIALEKCASEYVIKELPTSKIIELLSTRNNLFTGSNLKVLEIQSPDTLHKIATQNPVYYNELITKIIDGTDLDYSLFIRALDKTKLQSIIEKELTELNLSSLTSLLKSNPNIFKTAILNNKELCTNLINELSIATYYKLEDFFNNGKFTIDEKTIFIKNALHIKDSKVLNKLLQEIPVANRQKIYENKNLRTKLLNDNTYELDNCSIKHLQNNIEELKSLSPNLIITILQNSNPEFALELFSDKDILEKIFKDKKTTTISNLIGILKDKNDYLPILTNKDYLKYYNKNSFQEVIKLLPYPEKEALCTDTVLNHILDNRQDYISLFKKLQKSNRFLLNTLDFRIFEDFIFDIKYSVFVTITKYPDIQDALIRINKQVNLKSNFIDNLFSLIPEISLEPLKECLLIIADSADGLNRKTIGNISKMLNTLDFDKISCQEIKELTTYLLYSIPRYYNFTEKIKRPSKVVIPHNFNELKDYEKLIEDTITSKIHQCNPKETIRYFLEKHFKLSYEEATIILNKYSITHLDENIYKEEYSYLNNLRKIYNTDSASLIELDSVYKTYSMYDSFVIENKIKNMYGKIYNFELRNKNYQTKAITKSIYGKELKIYECPNEFMFLISNIDLTEELTKTNSYFESWHNTLNKSDTHLKASLISHDNPIINDDIIFGFNGIVSDCIIKMSPYDLCSSSSSIQKEKYMTPRDLIDYTRDTNNTIILNKFALRPNYNNSNIPNIEPDYILVDGQKLENKNYIELISRISTEFKTKRNKDGLPIIALNLDKISANEISKIKNSITKYQNTYDMTILSSIITKIEDNYSSYLSIENPLMTKFSPDEIIDIIKNRLTISNSISELKYIENLLTTELKKYQNTSKNQNSNINIKEIKELINERIRILNS